MGNNIKYLAIVLNIITIFSLASSDSYSVQVATEEHVNLVDVKFLSFTVDPKYLLSASKKYNSKECTCMATSLTPAYIRIAGPSTSLMTVKNTTITIDSRESSTNRNSNLEVTHKQWEKFLQWAQNIGFELVFAFNSDERSTSGMWDPNNSLNILSIADKINVDKIFWQLGYECFNQSIEEYLNDLETLRMIVETFPAGKDGRWQVVGGDVTHCLQAHSKSDFKDYVTLSNDMMDAILLNGNSSSQELERMSEKDRYKLLKLLSTSSTPLWLTEHSSMVSELERAADWMTSLGYSARNGFSVHYRELTEKELYEPTLSFYMALLFKNLVGQRVLNVDIEASQAILFAHCTSLRHKPVPGAVTFYGANMDDEPARFSIKMSKKEEGGDIMQFILGHDRNGYGSVHEAVAFKEPRSDSYGHMGCYMIKHETNIVVNGRPMYYEGDIRPVVKRVRPYKTLLINLPPKTFGFWVLANTLVQACHDVEDNKNKFDTISVNSGENEKNFIRSKRSLKRRDAYLMDAPESFIESMQVDNEIEMRMDTELRKGKIVSSPNINETTVTRLKRQAEDEIYRSQQKRDKKLRTKLKNGFDNESFRNNIFNAMKKLSNPRNGKIKRFRGLRRNYGMKSKRNLKDEIITKLRDNRDKLLKSENNDNIKIKGSVENQLVRRRRSVKCKNNVKYEDETSENEIDVDEKDTFKVANILQKLKKLSDLPLEIQEKDNNDYEEHESSEGIVLKTKLSDDSAVIDISEKSHSGLLKSTLHDILSILVDFNKNINRFWTAITLFE